MDGDWRFIYAAERDDVVRVRQLLDTTSSSAEDLAKYLIDAAALGAARVVELLLKRGASIGAVEDPTGFTALHAAVLAVSGDPVGVTKTLLGNGADVNATSADGMTALDYAASRGVVKVAEELLRAGCTSTRYAEWVKKVKDGYSEGPPDPKRRSR